MKKLLYLFGLFAVLCFAGCKNKEYITVERTKTDTIFKYKVRVDSIVKFDSITTTTKGDTVFRDRWHTLHVYHYRVDTVVQVKIVKEPQPYPVTEIKEVNVLHWWQNVLMFLGVGALSYIIWIVAIRLIKRKFNL